MILEDKQLILNISTYRLFMRAASRVWRQISNYSSSAYVVAHLVVSTRRSGQSQKKPKTLDCWWIGTCVVLDGWSDLPERVLNDPLTVRYVPVWACGCIIDANYKYMCVYTAV